MIAGAGVERAPLSRLDPWVLLGDSAAVAAVRRLCDAMRSRGHDRTPRTGPLAQLGLGFPVVRSILEEAVPAGTVDALAAAGALTEHDGAVALRFRLFAAGSVVAVVPITDDPYQEIYIGRDSMWLLQVVWRRAPGGASAVELGTGTGFLAAVLTSRYRFVLGTELLPDTAAFAALTLAVNSPERTNHRAAVCVADVGAGLRPGAFDLVAANPPYIPDPSPASGVARCSYAHGGPNGFDLPHRFIEEGLALLRPGGLLIANLLDSVLSDGRRPLQTYVRELQADGLSVEVVPAPPGRVPPTWEANLVSACPVLSSARLVSIIVQPS